MQRQNYARQLLFPNEMPPFDLDLLELVVSDATSPELYEQMRALDDAGQRGAPLEMDPSAGGTARIASESEQFADVNWAIYIGADRALQNLRFEPVSQPDLEVRTWLPAGPNDVEVVVDVLAARFLSLPLGDEGRERLADHLAERVASRVVDPTREDVEPHLRELLHLLLSLPEYQLS
jgi:hypothetical protein